MEPSERSGSSSSSRPSNAGKIVVHSAHIFSHSSSTVNDEYQSDITVAHEQSQRRMSDRILMPPPSMAPLKTKASGTQLRVSPSTTPSKTPKTPITMSDHPVEFVSNSVQVLGRPEDAPSMAPLKNKASGTQLRVSPSTTPSRVSPSTTPPKTPKPPTTMSDHPVEFVSNSVQVLGRPEDAPSMAPLKAKASGTQLRVSPSATPSRVSPSTTPPKTPTIMSDHPVEFVSNSVQVLGRPEDAPHSTGKYETAKYRYQAPNYVVMDIPDLWSNSKMEVVQEKNTRGPSALVGSEKPENDLIGEPDRQQSPDGEGSDAMDDFFNALSGKAAYRTGGAGLGRKFSSPSDVTPSQQTGQAVFLATFCSDHEPKGGGKVSNLSRKFSDSTPAAPLPTQEDLFVLKFLNRDSSRDRDDGDTSPPVDSSVPSEGFSLSTRPKRTRETEARSESSMESLVSSSTENGVALDLLVSSEERTRRRKRKHSKSSSSRESRSGKRKSSKKRSKDSSKDGKERKKKKSSSSSSSADKEKKSSSDRKEKSDSGKTTVEQQRRPQPRSSGSTSSSLKRLDDDGKDRSATDKSETPSKDSPKLDVEDGEILQEPRRERSPSLKRDERREHRSQARSPGRCEGLKDKREPTPPTDRRRERSWRDRVSQPPDGPRDLSEFDAVCRDRDRRSCSHISDRGAYGNRRDDDRRSYPASRDRPRRRSPDRRSSDRRSSDRRSPDRRNPDRRSPDRRSSDRRSPDRRSSDRRSPDRRSPDRRSSNRRSPDRGSHRSHFNAHVRDASATTPKKDVIVTDILDLIEKHLATKEDGQVVSDSSDTEDNASISNMSVFVTRPVMPKRSRHIEINLKSRRKRHASSHRSSLERSRRSSVSPGISVISRRGRERSISPPSRSRRHRASSYDTIRSSQLDYPMLRKIAAEKAIEFRQKGIIPPQYAMTPEERAIWKSGGKSLDDLTALCKQMAQREGRRGKGGDGDDDDRSSVPSDLPLAANHPFHVKERPLLNEINVTLRGGRTIALRTGQERTVQNLPLRQLYPVSTGSTHRDLTWQRVEPEPEMRPRELKPAGKDKADKSDKTKAGTVEGPEEQPVTLERQLASQLPPPDYRIPISFSDKLRLLKFQHELATNSDNPEVLGQMQNTHQQMMEWANQFQYRGTPGEFTPELEAVSTPVPLYQPWDRQAWVRKDQLMHLTPVGGKGQYLLQKMGWMLGQSIGLRNTGVLEPLKMEIKLNKRGLQAEGESRGQQPALRSGVQAVNFGGCTNVHPCSALNEACTKRGWGTPAFDLVREEGHAHTKTFLFKVKINGVEYRPTVTGTSKKLAKAEVAKWCLDALGLVG
ncbi:putative Protein SON [Hypsibius exemplaris]|uniref:Protein SON n=1 Tax=Hypsibius exemplaris TaxID=2072580 RepID=A0A1W0WTT8_HYPEX|nr:putative Protein SON [Hypsibius exemplaris]